MRLRNLLLSILLLLSNNGFADSFDMDSVKQLAEKYFSLIESYSDLPEGKQSINYHYDILKLFNEQSAVHLEIDFSSDLFLPAEQIEQTIESYLRLIKEKYRNKIEVTHFNKYYFNCVANIGNKKIAFVQFDKQLKYVGDIELNLPEKSKKVNLLIGIDVTKEYEYRILSIVSRPYNEIDKSCILDQKADEQSAQYKRFMNYGDSYFKKADFVTALSHYDKALSYATESSRVLSQIKLCEKAVTLESYKSKAEQYLNEKQYYKAKETFNKILSDYPSLNNYVETNISKCDIGIRMDKYAFFKRAGYENYKMSNFSKASENFNMALSYDNSERPLILDMIHKSNNGDLSKARREIGRAIYLAEKENNFVEAFKILTYYEGSGILSGQNYYFMAMMLDGNTRGIHKKMQYSKRQAYSLAKEYCIKGVNLGNKNAEFMWDRILNGTSKTDY